ncbi:hypothetical protein B0H13DRAFT_2017423 [Mycena leptocephala]|nr:hypothetical protein B0H13DRAFT_2017423 [Mycena leptocephala]
MNQQSLLFSSNTDLQRMRNMSCSSAALDHPYHATSSPDDWWTCGTSSFVRSQQDSTSILYRDSSIDSPYTQSPQIDANFPTSPGWPLLSIEPFDSDSWNEMILSALDTDVKPPPLPSRTPSLPCILSGLCYPVPRHPLRTPRLAANPRQPRGAAASTAPRAGRPARTATRPRRDDADPDAGVAPGAPECSHCHTHRTSVWRRSKTGAKLCNACGVYARLRGRDRPLSLRRNKIRPRCKHPK